MLTESSVIIVELNNVRRQRENLVFKFDVTQWVMEIFLYIIVVKIISYFEYATLTKILSLEEILKSQTIHTQKTNPKQQKNRSTLHIHRNDLERSASVEEQHTAQLDVQR